MRSKASAKRALAGIGLALGALPFALPADWLAQLEVLAQEAKDAIFNSFSSGAFYSERRSAGGQ